ncbi:MAG: TonB-dependent receptor [Hylemonella sp.]
MAQLKKRKRQLPPPSRTSLPATSARQQALLPLGAALLASSIGVLAQTAPAAPEKSLATVEVRAEAGAPEAKNSLRASETRIGKGQEKLRDIPQSITVHTERLMDDRNFDDLKEVLRTTGGITFLSGETGEEDIRMRGFSLLQAGDVYIDGMRDPSIYERDTFNYDRVEVLKGSASMLFGRGSTGGVVNQVNKMPFLMTLHEVKATVGTGNERRVSGDFNFKTGEDAALRLNVMKHDGGAYGTRIAKQGIAPTYCWGIGTADEYFVSLYHLEYDNRPVYNAPWRLANGEIQTTLDPRKYYGLASDYNRGTATYGTVGHTHRFEDGAELKTVLRHGRYTRDLWASVIGFANPAPPTVAAINDSTVLTRTQKGRVARSTITTLQSDYSDSFDWLGYRHKIVMGLDWSNEDALRNNNFSGGNAPAPLNTTLVGTPDDGEARPDLRGDPPMNSFNARNIGLYVQDTMQLTPTVKLVGGLRNDNFTASYYTAAGASHNRTDSLWSPRLGALYQPNDWASYHVSYGTSYNVSGDAYQYAVQGPSTRVANTPPEQSRNIEVGGKFDLFDKKLLLSAALFYSEKYNERNTDPDSAATQELLSGMRHASGLDVDIAGRITPAWDAFLSWTWIPDAKIDKSVPVTGNMPGKDDRPGLTPVHSASLWTTYRLNSQWRVGAGLNYRGRQTPLTNKTIYAKEFTTLDLMAEYQVSDNTSVKLNLNNVTDERYADALYSGFYAPGAPFSAQLTLKVQFE